MELFTIKNDSDFCYEEKRSKFLAFAFYVQSEVEIKEKLKKIKKEYGDARHICYAYVCGENTKSCDDGEPAGSAGQPILQTIKSLNLVNVLVVVVRYFGGILLGKNNLLRAYASASKTALELGFRIVLCEAEHCKICADYSNFNLVLDMLKKIETMKVETTFDESVVVKFWMKKECVGNFCEQLWGAGFEVEKLETKLLRWESEKN